MSEALLTEVAPQARLVAAVPSPVAYEAADIAALIKCSVRHIWRLNDLGLMPSPFRLGRRLVRWNKDVIDAWIRNGCPPQRKGAR
jgi:predicted DNA-binding transcriptional regulator AlpA